jgi:hypothetical protein
LNMEFDVFISYSSTDKTAAFAACAVLESAGVRCWIAPRDIRPGGEYGAAIIEAIEQSRVMVLIFSSSANSSRQIAREIERAVSKGIPLVPVRIEAVAPTKSMEYFLGAIHWLDALTPPIEQHLQHLAETVKAILRVDADARATSSNPAEGEKTGDPASLERGRMAGRQAAEAKTAVVYPKPATRPRWLLPALVIAACVVAVLGGVWLYETEPIDSAPSPVAAPAPPAPTPQPAPRQAAQLVPDAIPFVRESDRVAIRSEYLPASDHKALAVSFNRIGFTTGQPDEETAKTAAMASCTRATEALGIRNPCYLYAVGNNVVFTGGTPPMPASPWVIRNSAIERPFASKDLPLIADAARDYWERNYPKAGKPKSLALSPGGKLFYFTRTATMDEAIRRSLEACGFLAGIPCMIVALDDSFIVPIPVTMKVTGFLNLAGNTMMPPDTRDILTRRLGNATNAWNGIAIGANGKAGVILNAADEQSAIDGALADCGRQDRDCHVIVLGPFTVERDNSSK